MITLNVFQPLKNKSGQKVAFLNSKEDLDWLFSTHLKNIQHFSTINSFIIVGNEDYPDYIELYSDNNPELGSKPAFVIDFREN